VRKMDVELAQQTHSDSNPQGQKGTHDASC
jgi:hypothetical protein